MYVFLTVAALALNLKGSFDCLSTIGSVLRIVSKFHRYRNTTKHGPQPNTEPEPVICLHHGHQNVTLHYIQRDINMYVYVYDTYFDILSNVFCNSKFFLSCHKKCKTKKYIDTILQYKISHTWGHRGMETFSARGKTIGHRVSTIWILYNKYENCDPERRVHIVHVQSEYSIYHIDTRILIVHRECWQLDTVYFSTRIWIISVLIIRASIIHEAPGALDVHG